MFEKRDREFQEALEDADKLERRLGHLKFTRGMASVFAVVISCLFFVLVLMSIQMSRKSPVVLPVTPLVIFMAGQQVLTAALAHGEIRTLLAFKRLRELSANP